MPAQTDDRWTKTEVRNPKLENPQNGGNVRHGHRVLPLCGNSAWLPIIHSPRAGRPCNGEWVG